MPGTADQTEHARTRMIHAVGDTLATSGWLTRPLGPTTGIALSRTTGNAMMVTAQLTQTPSPNNGWPIEIGIRLGVAYEPAVDLSPVLGMRPVLALIDDPDTLHGAGYTLTLHHGGDVDVVAHAISTFVDTCAAGLAETFTTPSDIQDALTPARAGSGTGGHGGHSTPMQHNRSAELRLLLLAAAGNHADARELLADHSSRVSGRANSPSEQTLRFIRQLSRWLDAGGPTPAPLADTLALLPPHPRFPGQTFSASVAAGRQRAAAMKAALAAARLRSPGADLDQIVDILIEEHDRRGVHLAASDAALHAEQLLLERRPLGRLRTTLRGLDMIAAVGTDALRLIAHTGNRRTPDDRRRPPRATYHVTADPSLHIAVELDDRALDWLDHIATTTPRRLGPYVPVDVWLARRDADRSHRPRLTAHIGDRHVGTIPHRHLHAFDRVMNAATLFDEDPYLTGRLIHTRSGTLLEVPLPYSDTH